jgi:hypothetical protein
MVWQRFLVPSIGGSNPPTSTNNFLSPAELTVQDKVSKVRAAILGWSQRGNIFAEMPVLKEPNKVTYLLPYGFI